MASLPQAQLASLAKSTAGIYLQADTSGNALKALLNLAPLTALDQADSRSEVQGDQWQDSAIYLVWLLLPLVLLQRKYSHLLSLTALLLLPYQAKAFEWRDLWQTQQQQAKQDYAEGDFSSAQQKFTDPLWQGNAAYRSGDYQGAEQAYRRAVQAQPDAAALHNLGNSLAQQQRYQEALDAYTQALQHQPDFNPAQQNADLMQQLLRQQEQQQQQQQDGEKQQQDGEQQQSQNDSDSQSDSSSDNQSDSDSSAQQQDSAQQKEAEQQPQQAEPQATAEQQQQAETEDDSEQPQQAAIQEAWPNASAEEQQQLDNLLRKVQDDPALLLRNKMYLEYLKRQQQRLPSGVDEQW